MNKTENFASLRFRAKMGSGSILMDLGNLRVGFPSLSHPTSPRLRRGMPGAREVLRLLRRCASPYVLLSAFSFELWLSVLSLPREIDAVTAKRISLGSSVFPSDFHLLPSTFHLIAYEL